jgi:predicted regulator of Ras-like GTPase activity (Roadblock/LC7/MglB family)
MKEVLQELKGSMNGIVGSFIISEEGEVEAMDVPEIMEEPISKVAKTLHHVSNVIKSTKTVDKLTVDSKDLSLISIPAEKRILVVVTEKNINRPLFKLISNMAITKVKKAPMTPKAPPLDTGKICDLYDRLFGAAAKRLANIIGPKSATHFEAGAEEIKKSYPDLLGGLKFGSTGKPDMIEIRENARKISHKKEILEPFDKLLFSMLETVRNVAGSKQVEKANEEIEKIRDDYGII